MNVEEAVQDAFVEAVRRWPVELRRTGVEADHGPVLAVTVGQRVSTTGSLLTAFALPIWLYTRAGSVTASGCCGRSRCCSAC